MMSQYSFLLLALLTVAPPTSRAESEGLLQVAAHFSSSTCLLPCEKAQVNSWFFWRSTNRVEIRAHSGKVGELWKKDSSGRISFTYLEPSFMRGIEYNPTEVKAVIQEKNWEQLSTMSSEAERAQLKNVGFSDYFGFRAQKYEGRLNDCSVELTWLPDLMLSARRVSQCGNKQSVTEIVSLGIDPKTASATIDTNLSSYQLTDFADIGDLETSPGFEWIKQALLPGHEHHEH